MDLGGTATEVRIDFRKNFSPVIASDLEEAFYPDTGFGGWSHAPPSGGEIFYQNTPKRLTLFKKLKSTKRKLKGP
jgi:hypothetical protein